MEWPLVRAAGKERLQGMSLHLTTEGVLTKVSAEQVNSGEVEGVLIASADEWEALASRWPLKRLIEIWNAVPGVVPVGKFTSRAVALRRIWRALDRPEAAEPRPGKTKEEKPKFREGTKAAQVYALLCRPEGATVREIQQATGWQWHSVRGFLSASVRKQGRSLRAFQRAG